MSSESIRERLAGPPCSICGAPVGTAHGYSCPNHNRPKKVLPVMVELPRTDVELLLAAVKEAEEADLILDRITEVAANWPSFLNSELEVNLAHVKLRLRAALDALEAG